MSAEPLHDKLRRLRREQPAAPAKAEPAPAPTAGMPGWMKRRLARTAERDGASAPRPDDARTTLGEPADLVAAPGPAGEHAGRTLDYADAHVHGAFALAEVDAADAAELALLANDARLRELDLRDAVYLDTETTGLSGGAGTYVFMIGLGRFDGARFELWQGFLRSPAEERALLAAAAERIRASSGVVSFFGKSFDRHRLEDKMRLHGVAPPFAALPHLDLYHPLRRLYRPAYADGRLCTMERELCGVGRADDLPGSYAPEAWMDFLAARPHRLEDVFRHNRDDVLSLVTLAAHLARTREETRADGAPLPGSPGARAAGLASLLLAQRERKEAVRWIDVALGRLDAAHPTARALALERVRALRTLGEGERALRHARELTTGTEDHVAAHAQLELARLLERVAQDRAAALEACEHARTLAERTLVAVPRARLVAELERRMARLRAR